MLFSKVKDIKIRKQFLRNEYKLKCKKFTFINLVSKINTIAQDKEINNSSILEALYMTSGNNTSTYKTRFVRRCLLTNRSRSVTRSFNLSRNIFRNMLQFGIIPGYKKAVW